MVGHKFFVRSYRQKENVDHLGQTNNVQVFYEAPDFRTDDPKWVEYAPPSLPVAKKNKHEGAAVQVFKRRDLGLRRQGFYTYKVRLQSPYLRDALKATLETYGVSYEDNVFAESTAPHHGLFFSLDRIAEAAKTAGDDVTRSHCELLCSVVEDIFGSALDELEILTEGQKITFDLLWTFFPPGSLFGLRLDSSPPYAFRVQAVSQNSRSMKLTYEYVEFDGFRYGTVDQVATIPAFKGVVDVSAIPGFPYVDLSKDEELRMRLVERGKRAVDMQTICYMNYKPKASRPKSAGNGLREEEEAQRVIIDHFLCRLRKKHLPITPLSAYAKLFGDEDENDDVQGFSALHTPQREGAQLFEGQRGDKIYKFHDADDSSVYFQRAEGKHEAKQTSRRETSRRPTKAEIERNRRVILDSEDNLIIMGRVHGYSLAKQAWNIFHVDYLHPIEPNTSVFEKVVLDETKKDILRTLVESHKDTTAVHYDDLISGKGQCLLVILSGPPGTGKTLMAESLAEHMGCPLLRANPDYIQNAMDRLIDGYNANLRQFLEDAKEWGGLVLFDEPDFLFQNQESSTDRQELLAFLRYAEYFKGIIILTTNLGRTIDAAVISRAQIHITFPALTETMRARVWENFIERLPPDIGTLGQSEVARLATWQINGREIKNILNMSVSWCRKKQRPLSVDNIESLIVTICPTAQQKAGKVNGLSHDSARDKSKDDLFLLDI